MTINPTHITPVLNELERLTTLEDYRAVVFDLARFHPDIFIKLASKDIQRWKAMKDAGQKVQAVKEIGASFGFGLKEAVDYVNTL